MSTRLKKPHAKCHYYCTRTIASVSSVPCMTENHDISVVFLSFWGSKENVVLSGVQDLVLLSRLLSALTVKPLCWRAASLLCRGSQVRLQKRFFFNKWFILGKLSQRLLLAHSFRASRTGEWGSVTCPYLLSLSRKSTGSKLAQRDTEPGMSHL